MKFTGRYRLTPTLDRWVLEGEVKHFFFFKKWIEIQEYFDEREAALALHFHTYGSFR